MYAPTLELMGIGLDKLRPSKSPFHSVAPGKRVQPLGQIDLPVCFGTAANFRKEVLTFEVVGFRGSYHAILGRPCYAKFMAVPNYTYLKLKMPGPKGVITIGSSFEHAYECDVECIERAEAQAEDKALAATLDKMESEALDSTHRHAGSFGRGYQNGAPRPDPPRRQGVADQRHPRQQIGGGARRFPPRQRKHLCVEPLGHAWYTEGGRRTLP